VENFELLAEIDTLMCQAAKKLLLKDDVTPADIEAARKVLVHKGFKGISLESSEKTDTPLFNINDIPHATLLEMKQGVV